MKTRIRFDLGQVPAGRDFTVRAMVELEADGPKVETKAPLNLALVLDHSGSMSGPKLSNVKKAAKTLIEGLGEGDIFSLTVFDSTITPLIPPVLAGRSNGRVSDTIDSIRSGGSTFLSGGYEQGRRFIGENRNNGNISRIILLTDGLANQGIQSVEELSDITASMRDEGITTSTLGVGMDYNEELLGRMAEVGGGGAYFIERADEAEAVFREELKTLKTLAVTGCEVTFTPSEHALGFAQMNTYAERSRGTYILGDVYGGVTKRLILELRINAPSQAGPFSAGTFTIKYRDAAEEDLKESALTLDASMEAVTREAFRNVTPDRKVSVQAAFCLGAIAKKNARRLAGGGQFDEAAEVLTASADTISRMDLDDEAVEDLVKDLRTRARRMSEEREAFFTLREKKRMFHEADMASKFMNDKLSRMISRRRD